MLSTAGLFTFAVASLLLLLRLSQCYVDAGNNGAKLLSWLMHLYPKPKPWTENPYAVGHGPIKSGAASDCMQSCIESIAFAVRHDMLIHLHLRLDRSACTSNYGSCYLFAEYMQLMHVPKSLGGW